MVSVVMPARNVATYVDEAVRSVLAQRGVRFELLIADDASTDGTWERIQAYLGDPRVRAWRFRRRRGAAAVGNYLVSRARGAYIASCDSDDVILAGHLRTLAAVLDREPGIGVAYGDMIELSPRGRRRLLRRSPGPTETWDLLDGSLANGGTMVRRRLFKAAGGYRRELPFLEDCEFFFRLAELTRFRHVRGRPLYVYRRRAGSLSRQPRARWARAGRRILRETILRRYGFRVLW